MYVYIHVYIYIPLKKGAPNLFHGLPSVLEAHSLRADEVAAARL